MKFFFSRSNLSPLLTSTLGIVFLNVFDNQCSFNQSCKRKVQRYGASYWLETCRPTGNATLPGTTFPDYARLHLISLSFHVKLKGRIVIVSLEVLVLSSPSVMQSPLLKQPKQPKYDPVLDGSIVRRRVQFDFDVGRWKFSLPRCLCELNPFSFRSL